MGKEKYKSGFLIIAGVLLIVSAFVSFVGGMAYDCHKDVGNCYDEKGHVMIDQDCVVDKCYQNWWLISLAAVQFIAGLTVLLKGLD